MNEHDRDLILGLADGSLTGAEAEAARQRVDADPELAAELALQVAIRRELESMPQVALSEAERGTLRTHLRDQLHLEDAVAPAPVAAGRRRSSWWQPVLGVAAVAVVVTAVVVLPGNLGGSDDAATEEALTVTTVAASGADSADGGADGGAESDAPPPTIEVSSYGDVDGSDLLDATRGADSPDEVTESLARSGPPSLARSSIDVEAIEACLERLGDQLPEGDLSPIGAEETPDGLLIYFAVLDADGVDTIVTVDIDGCRIVDVDD